MTEQTAIEKRNGQELAHFGGRDSVRELATRLQATMPGGKKLTAIEATSLAQLSVAHGLDPFNGEAWIIPGSGLMVGIKGLRKTARKMARDENSTFWTDLRRVEPETYNAPKGAIVYECHLRDTTTIQAWSTSINLMTTAGVPYKDAVADLGPSPVKIGIGIATQDERSKMEIHARARKRAEADAIKQRYDVEFGTAEFSADDPDAVEAEFTVVPEQQEPRDEATIMAELGFDAPEDEEDEEIPASSEPETESEVDGPTVFWSFVKQRKDIDDDEANAVLKECGGDFTKAMKALKKNHAAPDSKQAELAI